MERRNDIVRYDSIDYYDEGMSYVEMILSLLSEEVDRTKIDCIRVIYREYLKNASVQAIEEIEKISSVFSQRLISERMSGRDTATSFAKSIYDLFLSPCIFSANYRNETVFNAMNCAVKVYLGLFVGYEEINDDIYNHGTRGNLRG